MLIKNNKLFNNHVLKRFLHVPLNHSLSPRGSRGKNKYRSFFKIVETEKVFKPIVV